MDKGTEALWYDLLLEEMCRHGDQPGNESAFFGDRTLLTAKIADWELTISERSGDYAWFLWTQLRVYFPVRQLRYNGDWSTTVFSVCSVSRNPNDRLEEVVGR